MTPKILKFLDSPKTQKSNIYENEIFLLDKKIIIKTCNMAKNGFLAKETLNLTHF